jgi:type II secretory pathway component PulC
MNRLLYTCLTIAFAGIAIGAWLVPPAALGPRPAMPVPRVSDSLDLAAPQRLDDFAALAERPPFAASRRAAPSAGGDTAALVLGRYRLSGVVVAPTSRSVILSGADNRSLVVAEGETLDGWTVDEITAEKVVFTSNGRREVFDVERAGD